MIVHKFGGTSVGDASRFAAAADIIIEHDRRWRAGYGENGTVVVVSAMAGVTTSLIRGARAAAEGEEATGRKIKDELIHQHRRAVEALLPVGPERDELVRQIEGQFHKLERLYHSLFLLGELTARAADAVASLGEPLSAAILAAVLRQRGLESRALTTVDLVVTDERFGAAEPLFEETRRRLEERVRPLLAVGVLPVLTGYIGGTESGAVTTLGRGGSDVSAALIGAALDAREVWIWSDVDGILTADPNLVPAARTIERLSYEEAAALAYYGADVLHPRTVRPLAERGIPLRILNSFRPTHPGTLILDDPGREKPRPPAIISTTGLSFIAVRVMDESRASHLAAGILQKLTETGIEVLQFSRSFSDHSLNLIVREPDREPCLKLLSREFAPGPSAEDVRFQVSENVATISISGGSEWNGRGLVGQVFAALSRLETPVLAIAQAGGEGGLSICVAESQTAGTVRFLHRELGLED